MQIIKASGEKEEFSQEKFCASMDKAGIPSALVEKTCHIVAERIEPGTSTEEIFQKAREILMAENPILAGKYSLKRAIMELGPAGFLFEQYLAAILSEYGHSVKTNQMMQGKCVEHETDLVSEYQNEHFIIEAKYHNSRGIKSNIQTTMYAHARFMDIQIHQENKEGERFDHNMWLITNTKFTSKALDYADCCGLRLTGWNYPKGESLRDLIDDKLLYPVTLLPAVNKFAREAFAKEEIYFAKDLTFFDKQDLVDRFNIFPEIAEDIHNQAQALAAP